MRPAAKGPKTRSICVGWPVTLLAVSTNTEAGLVGSRPATYLNWLFWPVPSASAPGAAAGLVVLPKYCTCHCWNGVRGVDVVALASSEAALWQPPLTVVTT